MTEPSTSPEGQIHKAIGLWDVFAIAAGAMISSGLFVLPGLAFSRTGPSVIFAYALAAVLYLPTLFAQAELATAMPKAGGSYFSIERSLGAYAGTIAGMISWLSIAFKAAFALIGLGTLAALELPDDWSAWEGWVLKGVAAIACLLFGLLNLRSVSGAGHAQKFLVFGLLGILVLYIIWGAQQAQPAQFAPLFKEGLLPFLAVTGMIFVSYGGLNAVVEVAEEVRNPSRDLPMGMFMAFAVVNLIYVFAVAVTVGLVPGESLSGSLTPIADGAFAVAGPVGLGAIGLASFLAYATTGNAGILSASRSPLAMSRDGLAPAWLGRIHPRWHTPVAAILLTTGLITLIVTGLALDDLVKTASTLLLLSFILSNIALLIMRKAAIPGYRPTFRAPLCPWPQLLAIAVYIFLITDMGRVPLMVSGGFLLAASLWYIIYVNPRIDRESAVIYMVKSILWNHFKRSGLEDELQRISLERDDVQEDRFDQLVRNCPVLDLEGPIDAHACFRDVAKALTPRLSITEDQLYHALLEREKESSTVIQPGLAIPHILLDGEHLFEMALVRSKDGVIFSELNPPVHTAFILLGSADERNFHLKALVAIAHIVQEHDFAHRWIEAKNAEQLRDVVILSRRKRMGQTT